MKNPLLRFCPLFLPAALFLAAAGPGRADVPVEEMRRLYDFTPIGPDNPVVARVADCGIAIPVSEFRAYVAGEVPDAAARAALPPSDRRRHLQSLLDDHFLLWDGYQLKADQTENVAGMLRSTQLMLLEEALTQQELAAAGKPPEQGDALLGKLRDRLFDQTDISVDPAAYDKLKTEARRMNRTAGALEMLGKPGAEKDGEGGAARLSAAVRAMPLARCKIAIITIGDFLQAYAEMPLPQRPDLENHDISARSATSVPPGVIAVLKQMLGPDLLVAEARARGLDKTPQYREKMQLNRNVLTRLYALDQLTARAVAQMKSPDIDARLMEWYQANLKKLYTLPGKDGKAQVLPFAANRDRISDDYFQDLQDRIRADQIRAWRKEHGVEIDEAVLAKAAL